MTIKEKIIERFNASPEQTVKELVYSTKGSKQMVHLVLKTLLSEKKLRKFGRAPKTIYKWLDDQLLAEPVSEYRNIDELDQDFLTAYFLYISELGEMLVGGEGFEIWCKKRAQPFAKTIKEFIKTRKKYDSYFDENGFIDGSEKLIKTYKENAYLNQIYYLDFYAIERFGKTRLGTLLHYAKQGQNKFLMDILISEIKERVKAFIVIHKIDAVCFVPPTIRREVQIMKFIQEHLNLGLPLIEIKKISGIIPVPQKSLSKIEERINNAKNTFAVTEMRQFNNVLLIDDAVGSGATLNEIALKVKQKKVGKNVVGLAIVGSFKGFDVITDI